MSSWRAFCETVHVTALGLWAGAVLMSGATAAIVFPTMKALHPALEGYKAFPDQTYLVVAGTVQQQVFLISDYVGFFCAMAASVSLICLVGVFKTPMRRVATVMRALALAVAVAALASLLFVVNPTLNAASVAHWAALKAGDAALVAKHKAALEQIHPIASTLVMTMASSVLIALVAAAWSMSSFNRERGAGTGGGQRPTRTKNAYARPAMLRGNKA